MHAKNLHKYTYIHLHTNFHALSNTNKHTHARTHTFTNTHSCDPKLYTYEILCAFTHLQPIPCFLKQITKL